MEPSVDNTVVEVEDGDNNSNKEAKKEERKRLREEEEDPDYVPPAKVTKTPKEIATDTFVIDKLRNMILWLSKLKPVSNNQQIVKHLKIFADDPNGKLGLFKMWIREQVKPKMDPISHKVTDAFLTALLVEYKLAPHAFANEEKEKLKAYLCCFAEVICK